MKKLLLLILLLSVTNSFAQDFSITDQGNKWGLKYFDGHCDNNEDPDIECEQDGVELIRINGEAVFNNITYAILEGSFTGGAMYIREEQGVVYQYSESEGEIILYDFTLEVGDTIEIGPEASCFDDENNNNLADVIDVSTEFIAGYDRKVITFDIIYGSNFSGNVQWIEGIGSANDPTNPDFLLCDFVIVINCFNNGEEIFSFTENEEECDSALSTSEIPKVTALLTPNPITEQSLLTINNFQDNTTITFYNILGQFISKKEVTNNAMVIHRSDFPSNGIYFYQIDQDGVIAKTQKFIVK